MRIEAGARARLDGRGGAGGSGRAAPEQRTPGGGARPYAAPAGRAVRGAALRGGRAASTLGDGAKHARGTRRARLSSYHAPHVQPRTVDGQTAVRFAASPHSTIASSCVRSTRGSATGAAGSPCLRRTEGSQQRRTARPAAPARSRRPRPPRPADRRRSGSSAGSAPQRRASTARTRAPASASETGQDAVAGAEVEHQRARPDTGVADKLLCEGATTKRWRPRGRACGEARPATEEVIVGIG